MAQMPTTIQDIESAISFLRHVGREAEANSVAALLAELRPAQSPPSSHSDELVPLAEAARPLGTSRQGVRRLIAHGSLVGVPGEENGDLLVTRRSLERLHVVPRESEIVARQLGAEDEFEWDLSTNLGRMFSDSLRQMDQLERAEIEQEEREDRAAVAVVSPLARA